MICVPNFPGDDDQRLFHMQHDAYSPALWTIVNAAKERFLEAEKVLRCSPTMGVAVRQLNSIDHRTVQNMHDLIAAWYRFKRKTERLFPLGGDLPEDWIQFITAEAHELCRDANFVTGVLDACIYANAEPGYAGERRARTIQHGRYSEMLHYALPSSQPETKSPSTLDPEN